MGLKMNYVGGIRAKWSDNESQTTKIHLYSQPSLKLAACCGGSTYFNHELFTFHFIFHTDISSRHGIDIV